MTSINKEKMENKPFIENALNFEEEIIKKIKIYVEAKSAEAGRPLYYYNFVMGCQMNFHDSEKISGMLSLMGYVETKEESMADFIIYNTCTVRENADQKVYGKLGYLKHYKTKNPNLIIALCGCMMQQPGVIGKIRSSYKQVDIVFGTFNLHKLPELILNHFESGSQIIDIWEKQDGIHENLPIIRENSYKASVNIMYGCNNFCSYCIVPYVRGRERSRNPEDIIKEISHLADEGIKEIMLLGQNVNSYGKNLENPVTFPELLRMANEVKGIERIRFMTSHPKDLSDELIMAMKECEKVCNYIHLPVQSGSSILLEKMNRHYTKEKYIELIEKIRKEIPDILISTDIIIGFPGETDEDINDTIEVIEKCRFSNAFTFIYSKRTGTPAADFIDNTPESVKKERFQKVLNALNKTVDKVHSEFVGKTVMVVPEEINKQDKTLLTGRSDNNLLVHFKGDSELIGKAVPVIINENKTFYLLGSIKE